MFLNTVVLWALIGATVVSEVFALRFTSPKHLFSEEPNILDEMIHVSKQEHGRFARSTNEEPFKSRTRRASTSAKRPPNPTITKSDSICNHDALLMRWSFDNVLSQTGTIIALCVSSSSRSSQSSVVYASYDHGASWQNLTSKFQSSPGQKISISNYYFVKEKPNFMIFTDKANKKIFRTTDGAKTISSETLNFYPDRISINPLKPNIVLISDDTSSKVGGKTKTRVHISQDYGQNFSILRRFVDVKAAWWGSQEFGDKPTDLFIEAKKDGEGTQGYKLDCSSTTVQPCGSPTPLTSGAPLNGDIIDFLVKGDYMFVTQHNVGKTGVNLFVKYKRTGTFRKAKIITSSPLKEAFVYDVSGGHVMLVVNHRKNETNLYNSFDVSGLNYSLSLPRVLYHNPHTEVSSLWLRNAVKYRFVDIWKVQALPSVYFATQLTQGPVGGRYLISMMTFDKGGLWKKVQGPPKNKYDRPCTYPACSLHVNLMYGSIYRYSKTTPLLSRKSAPGLIMVTGVLGTNLKITPETYLSRDGGSTFKMVLRGKRRYNFGDHGGVILTSDFSSSRYLQFSVNFENFYYVPLPNTPRSVEIKKIVTEPGERGAVFLVIAYDRIDDQFYVYHVNATNSLGVPCTKDDYYNMTVADIGVGGCAIKTVEIRNASRRCLTGKNYTREVKSISYENCMCRRRHYACDFGFVPDERGSCVLMENAKVNLIPKICPEGQTFMKTRGYLKLDEFKTCTEDDATLNTLSYAKTPCPVEKLELARVRTVPAMKNRMVRIAHGETLKVDVKLKNGFLPNVNFMHVLDTYNSSGSGAEFASRPIKMNKPGSFVLHITVSNPKSVFYYSVNVHVIRKLNSSMASILTFPVEPSIKEQVTVMLQMAKYLNPRDYGFPLEYYKWKVETFKPSHKTIFEGTTSLPSIQVSFNVSGSKKITATISNGANVSTITVTKDIMVTTDMKPKNVRLSYKDPNLIVKWDIVREPGVLRYRINYRKEGDDHFQEASCRPLPTETKCEISPVLYYTKYFAKVQVAMSTDFGPSSDVKHITIPSGKPSVPQLVNLANEKETKLEATWQPPLSPNGKIIGYRYKFYKSGQNPPTDGVLIRDATANRKVFDKLEDDENYMFEIAAVNEDYTGVYSEARSATTGVDKPVLPPTGIMTTIKTPTSVTLVWTAPLIRKGSTYFFSPKSYNIYLRKDGVLTKHATARTNTYTFNKLRPATRYEGSISAVANEEGPKGDFSFKTLPGATLPPINFTTKAIGSTYATFTWRPAIPDGNILHFSLHQLVPKTNRQPWRFTTTTGNVTDLKPHTKYIFAATAFNGHSPSGISKNASFTTKQDRPSEPVNVKSDNLWPGSSSVNITWKPPKDQNGVIIKYTLEWSPPLNAAAHIATKAVRDKQPVVLPPGARWIRIDHLRQKTKYIFILRAWTIVGKGDPYLEIHTTPKYPHGSQSITIQFEDKYKVEDFGVKTTFEKDFVEAVSKAADIRKERIADVRLKPDENAVVFELITKEELLNKLDDEIFAEMDVVKNKLQISFKVGDARTKANGLKAGKIHLSASTGSQATSSSKALIVGLVCAAVIIALIVIIAMMFYRHRRKSVYNKFDNNFQYSHEDDSVRYQSSPEIELAPPTQKRRHKNIETVPLADADELT